MEGSAANTAGVFLLTPLREGRHTAAAPVNPTSCISTHAPAGGATRGTSCPCLSLCNFYSRPCGRGDLRDFPVFHVGIAISTHAPAGGATIGPHSFRKVYAVISTHAPAGGATPVSHTEGEAIALFLLTPLREGRLELDVLALCLVDFYSRPCGRGDLEQEGVTMEMKIISTHAPAGGATSLACSWSMSIILFLLTPLREGRPATPTRRSISSSFLLTPLREGRLRHAEKGRRNNPISTHAPAGGATVGFTTIVHNRKISTHAPAGGATGFRYDKRARSIISTHAPAGGATGSRAGRGRRGSISTHAPAGGATCCSCGYGCG